MALLARGLEQRAGAGGRGGQGAGGALTPLKPLSLQLNSSSRRRMWAILGQGCPEAERIVECLLLTNTDLWNLTNLSRQPLWHQPIHSLGLGRAQGITRNQQMTEPGLVCRGRKNTRFPSQALGSDLPHGLQSLLFSPHSSQPKRHSSSMVTLQRPGPKVAKRTNKESQKLERTLFSSAARPPP